MEDINELAFERLGVPQTPAMKLERKMEANKEDRAYTQQPAWWAKP